MFDSFAPSYTRLQSLAETYLTLAKFLTKTMSQRMQALRVAQTAFCWHDRDEQPLMLTAAATDRLHGNKK